jgi:hypothetical protein
MAAPTSATPSPSAAPVATVSSAVAAAQAGSGEGAPPGMPPPQAPPPARRWKRLLAWLLLALLLLALLFLGWRCSTPARVADAGLAQEIAQAEARNRQLEEELLRKQRRASMECVADTPMPIASAPPPPPVASAPEPVASAPQPVPAASAPVPQPAPSRPAPSPLDDLKKRIAGAARNCDALAAMLKGEPLLQGSGAQAAALKQQVMKQLETHCRERAIQEAKNLCPGQRPPELAPEIAIVFDASGSMKYSLDATEQEIAQAGQVQALEEMMRQFGIGGRGGGGAVVERLTREPRRITVARQATQSVVQRLPSDMNVGLVTIEECPSARTVGRFAPSQRGALLGRIQGIEPRAGTPLADGIAKGGQLVDGVDREALMVVVSDGTESCEQDPCAVAAALKRAKPRLKINVVDITGTGAGNCVAQATGGRVFTAKNADELVGMTERAAREAMGPGNCKP